MASIVPSSSKDCFKSGTQGSCRWSTADGLTLTIRVKAPENLILQHPGSDTTGTVSVISAKPGDDEEAEPHSFTRTAKRLTKLEVKSDNTESFTNTAYELRLPPRSEVKESESKQASSDAGQTEGLPSALDLSISRFVGMQRQTPLFQALTKCGNRVCPGSLVLSGIRYEGEMSGFAKSLTWSYPSEVILSDQTKRDQETEQVKNFNDIEYQFKWAPSTGIEWRDAWEGLTDDDKTRLDQGLHEEMFPDFVIRDTLDD